MSCDLIFYHHKISKKKTKKKSSRSLDLLFPIHFKFSVAVNVYPIALMLKELPFCSSALSILFSEDLNLHLVLLSIIIYLLDVSKCQAIFAILYHWGIKRYLTSLCLIQKFLSLCCFLAIIILLLLLLCYGTSFSVISLSILSTSLIIKLQRVLLQLHFY